LSALVEFGNLSQRAGEPRRRWFESDDEDLIVWFSGDGAIVGFQLCYDRRREERALTWHAEEGYSHMRVDDGEAIGQVRKSSPVLFPDGAFDAGAMLTRFRAIAGDVPEDIAAFVSRKITEYPSPAIR
jgi:hypothetical protein